MARWSPSAVEVSALVLIKQDFGADYAGPAYYRLARVTGYFDQRAGLWHWQRWWLVPGALGRAMKLDNAEFYARQIARGDGGLYLGVGIANAPLTTSEVLARCPDNAELTAIMLEAFGREG